MYGFVVIHAVLVLYSQFKLLILRQLTWWYKCVTKPESCCLKELIYLWISAWIITWNEKITG